MLLGIWHNIIMQDYHVFCETFVMNSPVWKWSYILIDISISIGTCVLLVAEC